MRDLNYNFIIAGVDNYYSVVYEDLQNKSSICCYRNYIHGINWKLVQFLIRANFNIRLNKYFKTPLKFIAYPLIFKNQFKDKKPICYLFFENQYAVINTSYIEYLKRKDANAKFVLYMQDLVSSLPYYKINEYKAKFDLILSYDKGDCEKYNLIYNPTPYSKLLHSSYSTKEESDIFFCGYAKQRLPAIIEVYDRCTDAGLKCLFFIMGVPKDKQIERKGIIYDSPMSYDENISYVKQSKCILEIMQEHATGYTLRLWESIVYDKHLLSNNITIQESEYYHSDYIHFIQKDNSFDWISKKVKYSDNVKQSLSPIALIERIDSLL